MALRLQPFTHSDPLFGMAMAIRVEVFVREQHVPPELEPDEHDGEAHHVIAFEEDRAVGTGRFYALEAPPEGEQGRWCRVGRMAVLGAYRGKGVGATLLADLEAEASRRGFDGVVLSAQVRARRFYERSGYRALGEVYDDAGIEHVEMRKRLRAG